MHFSGISIAVISYCIQAFSELTTCVARVVYVFNAKTRFAEFYDLCETTPCRNRGTCYTHNGKPICLCEQNYFGDTCEGMYNVCMLQNV